MSASGDIVYLDYAATTPVDPEVIEVMTEVLESKSDFANPSALHAAGRRSRGRVEDALANIGMLLNCAPDRLVTTSGATESINLAVQGAARYRARRGRHLITMPTEHKAAVDTFRMLEKRGFSVTWLAVGSDGYVDVGELDAAIRADTQLVSIMHVNNETGVVQNVDRIGELCRERDVLLHVDAAQSVGKLPIDLAMQPIDLLSFSAHKFYGPQGIGGLYIADRRACHIEPLFFGGRQQRGLRPGTLPVHLVAGFGKAAELAGHRMAGDLDHARNLRDRLWGQICDIPGILVNGDTRNGFPGILNVSIDDIEGESLLLALEPVCVSTGSACNAQSDEPSAVLRAMGRSDLLAQSAIRFSFGRRASDADIDIAAARYRQAVEHLRSLAPEQAA